MANELKLAIIGLDTSHAVRFPEIMQSPDVPEDQRVTGMRAVTCLKFMTPFTTDEVLAERTTQLESWGVTVTEDFGEAVADCDAILIEINDPELHLEYFTRCADLGKPVFLDKPPANTFEHARRIAEIAEAKGVRWFTASSLRFVVELEEACAAVGAPGLTTVYGPLGKALSGSSIVWYGVHAFEMLERAMGRGATRVTAVKDPVGAVVVVEYPEDRRGVVELTEGNGQYGGVLRSSEKAVSYHVDMSRAYGGLLKQVVAFLTEGAQPVDVQDSLEIMKLLDAADESYRTGTSVPL